MRAWQIALGLLALAGVAMSIAALVLATRQPSISTLSVYSDAAQYLSEPDEWSDIVYQGELFRQSDDWVHTTGSALLQYTNGQTRHFMMYMSVQAGLDTMAPTSAPTTAPTRAPTSAP